MKIPADKDGEAIESPIAVMFALPEYRKCFKEWQQKRDYHNGVINEGRIWSGSYSGIMKGRYFNELLF